MNSAAAGFVLPNSYFLYSSSQILPRSRLYFTEALDLGDMQEALNAVMAETDYFGLKLVQTEEGFSFCPNDKPCVVYSGSKPRKIPEETNDYLFYVSCDGCVMHLDFIHCLTDAHGSFRFIEELVKEYCNRHYHTHFLRRALVSDPPITEEDVYGYGNDCPPQNNDPETIPAVVLPEVKTSIVRFDKADVVQKALALNVKPFSYLMYLAYQCVRETNDDELISISFPIDVRKAVGRPNAIYNCAAPTRQAFASSGEELYEMNRFVMDSTDPDAERALYGAIMKNQLDIMKMKKPLRKKIQLGELIRRRSIPHMLLTYTGDPFGSEAGLKEYVRDFQAIFTEFETPVLIVEVTYNDQMNLHIADRSGKNIAELVKRNAERHGIKVCGVEYIDI